LSTIAPEEVKWLWYPYLPIGKLVVVEGHPGEGKTWLMLALAAAITAGRMILPVQSLTDIGKQMKLAPRKVIYMTAEDGLADTMRPRFDRIGGDPSMMVMLEERSRKGKLSLLSLHEDLDLIEQQIVKHNPLLVVVDPLDAYLGDRVDFFRANEVRPILGRINLLSGRHRLVFNLVRHYAKAPKERAILKGQGTIAIAAAARSLLQVGSLRDLPHHFAFSHTKNNLGPKGPSMEFAIEEGRFSWVGPNEFVTTSTLNAPEPVASSQDDAHTATDAVTFLREFLGAGPRPVEEVYKQAKAKLRLPATAISHARHTLRLNVSKNGEEWYWSLPT
jgi:RecA-family ATPase